VHPCVQLHGVGLALDLSCAANVAAALPESIRKFFAKLKELKIRSPLLRFIL
jgi:hypothetical protein